tara:strand:+ start:238 stop:621 length:384 start_codon:yes stop_codon:yes gene_type:complete
MLNFITKSISLLVISITGWALTTYYINKDSQKLIGEELGNLFDIFKKFFASITNLIKILASSSLEKRKSSSIEEKVLEKDEQPLNLVQPIKEIKDQSIDLRYDDDEALSSFSPEVVDVINEEEERVA